jgi:hypothetical protein
MDPTDPHPEHKLQERGKLFRKKNKFPGTGNVNKESRTFMPALARARRADWAPGPGVLVLLPPVARSLMCRAVMPKVFTDQSGGQSFKL